MRLTGFRLVVVDFVLLTVAFFAVNCFKRGSLVLPDGYGLLLVLFYGAWVVSGLAGKKFVPAEYWTFRVGARTVVKSALYLVFTIAFVVVMFGLSRYSRVHVFATCGVMLGLELLVWGAAARYVTLPDAGADDPEAEDDPDAGTRERPRFSLKFALVDLGLFFAAFFAVNVMKRGTVVPPDGYEQLMLMLLALGVAAAVATRKYDVIQHRNLYFALWQWVKAGLLLMAGAGVMVFGLRWFQYSRFQGFGTVVVLMVLEAVVLVVYFSVRKDRKAKGDIESVDQVRQMLTQERYDLNVDIETVRQRLMRPAIYKLERSLQTDEQKFLAFLRKHVDLDDILYVETQVERNSNCFELRDDYLMLRLFVGLRKLNDCRRLNVHFLSLHQMLLPGGYFAGYAHTIKTHHEWIYAKFPRPVAHGVYALDFLFHRVCPKLPWIQKVYFAVTKGRNRIISRAELLGRLCFCGFDIVDTKEMDKKFYFIARKVKTASMDNSPTYGPLVALKRSGLEGKTVHTFKFRTMHPYSEYLQAYMYDRYGLQKGGKIENDFRLTTWGKVMRKLWLDELPMLYNWVKGDFGLVGVRPLSYQYLSLYDDDLQELRKKVRPGLVPPFYADLPETFEEICESERRYIRSFLARPVRTQIRYFTKSFVNIAFKGARSK
ncbi:sugar transferase [Desulfotignum phosphitoxidans]|uniref:Putative sugar transferase n=1 Tax=Desulfotignum phosphitoxidans DSM 13687 TaxID=1286635 RepID=S0G0F9_9BACT|nr:sugar transferase [Desulfotignum phosphitoxidans]EMS77677.1 putative sugar transferase [Desulfotignum phosphitoxidans DSM 13687]